MEAAVPDLAALARALVQLGCPAEHADLMARQLDRRARMDAEQHGLPYETALRRLLGRMREGWNAPSRSP